MPHYAYLVTDLRCPACSAIVSDRVWFQWGFCVRWVPPEEEMYHTGDPIRWKQCADGSILSWTYFEPAGGGNIGDPAFINLLVRDAVQFCWEDPAQRKRCERCDQPIAGAVVEIREGVIQQAWIYQPGEFDQGTDIYLIQPDGTRKPMAEWDDHPMSVVDHC